MSGLRLELCAEELARLARELDELAAAAASAAGSTGAALAGHAWVDGLAGERQRCSGHAVADGLHNIAGWFDNYAGAVGAVAGVLHTAASTVVATDEDRGRLVSHGPGALQQVPDDLWLA